MNFKELHRWNLSLEEAKNLQIRLSKKISLQNQFSKINLIAASDVAVNPLRSSHGALDPVFAANKFGIHPRLKTQGILPSNRVNLSTDESFAGVIVYRYPDLEEVERQSAKMKIAFPYIPGFLSFREIPVLLKAFARLKNLPDLILVDGQGIAHPRGLGIASHLGLILDKPSIGCAKSYLFGTYKEPAKSFGSFSHLRNGKKKIGAILRTRENVKPIFVSPGHKIDLETSIQIVLACCDGFRIPKPQRIADRFANSLKNLNL